MNHFLFLRSTANTVTIVWSEEVESQSGYGETSINASESKRQKVKTIK